MKRPIILALVAALTSSASYGATANSSPHQQFLAEHYPVAALKKGEEGKVGFAVDLAKTGGIEQCRITSSSGYPDLDRETCDFIVQYLGLGPARDAQGRSYAATKVGIIDWQLPAGIARSTAPKIVAAALPAPLICKRTVNTGSVISHTTECMTNDEWAFQDKLVRQELESRIGSKRCTVEGC